MKMQNGRVHLLDQRLAAVAARLVAGKADAPKAHRQLVDLIDERGAAFRMDHAAKTRRLAAAIENDPTMALDLAAELAMRVDGD